MYEYLEGTLATRGAGRIVIDVNGVGYDVSVPIGASFHAEKRTRVWTHFVVRDDAHVLCGFPDRETRDVFRMLLSVTGVGPVMALTILSGIDREHLIQAIVEGDVGALTRIKGIGAKTANQILLDLKAKAQKLLAQSKAGTVEGGVATPAARESLVDDAVAALVSIGYSEKEAKKTVEKALDKVGGKRDLESVLRAALTS